MNRRMLLVTDDQMTDRYLATALAKAAPGWDLEPAKRRAQIEGTRRPGLVVLDLTLRGEPALELLRWMRSSKEFRQVPVFALGASENDINRAYALGANSCLLKRAFAEGYESIARGIAEYASLIPMVRSASN